MTDTFSRIGTAISPTTAQGIRHRLLFLNLHTEMGGGEYSVYHLVRSLDAQKWEAVMVFGGSGTFVDKSKTLGCATVTVPFPAVMVRQLIAPAEMIRAIRSAKQLGKLLSKREIDIVCCSDIVTLLLIAVPALLRRIPVVYTVIFFHEWTRMLLFNLLALMLVDRIVATSPLLADDLRQRTMFLGSKVEVDTPGVDTAVFRPIRSGEANRLRNELMADDTTKIVGMVARFEPVKGHIDFIRAAVEVVSRRSDVRFVLIGDDVNSAVMPSLAAYRDEVIAEATRSGLGDRLVFLGYRRDTPELIRGLDLLVCPSLHEGFGLVVLEGLASGVPVIVSRSAGAWEIVKEMPGVAGILPGDVESLARNIVAALDRPAVAGIEEPVAPLTWNRYGARMEEVYEAVLSERDYKYSSSHWSTTI